MCTREIIFEGTLMGTIYYIQVDYYAHTTASNQDVNRFRSEPDRDRRLLARKCDERSERMFESAYACG